ncbi:MAG TPA: response regulator transcription factor [Solirubrobacteraceae bacterium]|jgi:DNA-binding NarL/FixJ family response regulator|nr:response regulator transcription factor [Solirubrobacteraceae bacterium]
MKPVLIVDDGAADRELLVTILRHAGYPVFEAASGDQALRLARAHKPSLIIADILMPTMDGYELVRELRSDPETAGIAVIFYTATYVLEEVKDLAAACGVSRILIKPCEPEEVLSVVKETLAQRPEPAASLPSEEFHREHLRLLNAKLLQKIDELRETVILAGALQRETDTATHNGEWPMLAADAQLQELSPRELQVLSMIVEGATNGEIAARLVIATSTVQSHVKRILHKLGVKNRTEAAVRYLRR